MYVSLIGTSTNLSIGSLYTRKSNLTFCCCGGFQFGEVFVVEIEYERVQISFSLKIINWYFF